MPSMAGSAYPPAGQSSQVIGAHIFGQPLQRPRRLAKGALVPLLTDVRNRPDAVLSSAFHQLYTTIQGTAFLSLVDCYRSNQSRSDRDHAIARYAVSGAQRVNPRHGSSLLQVLVGYPNGKGTQGLLYTSGRSVICWSLRQSGWSTDSSAPMPSSSISCSGLLRRPVPSEARTYPSRSAR